MKFISLFLFLLSTLTAHGTGENHLHFFSTLHIEEFALFIAGLVASILVYRYLKKETN